MEKIYSLLERHRLERFYNQFIDFGIKEECDFIDSVDDDTLTNMGLTQAEKNRFQNMLSHVKKIGITPGTGLQMPVRKSLEEFCLIIRFPKCDAPRNITGLDPSQNTVEDLMLRICHQEKIPTDMSVCLYTTDGMPLTDDPFFNTWSLKERHIKSLSELYAIFTKKRNLRAHQQTQKDKNMENDGPHTVRCHVMFRGNYDIKVDLESHSLRDVKKRLSSESNIPANVLHIKYETHDITETLRKIGVTEKSVLNFFLSSFDDDIKPSPQQLCTVNDVEPTVMQTQMGMSFFFSTLYTIILRHCGEQFKKVIAYIRKLTGCNPLAQSLYHLICGNMTISRNQKISIVEGLYMLFRELLPRNSDRSGPTTVEDNEVFEYSNICWAYLLLQGENENPDQENYAVISLKDSTLKRLSEPVRIPGTPEVFDRAFVLEKISDGDTIPGADPNLKESSIERAIDIEKILLSLPPVFERYPLWISFKSAPQNYNFQIQRVKTFAEMFEDVNKYTHLVITPPLQLRNMGCVGPLLVFLDEDNLGVYLENRKDNTPSITAFDCIKGKEVTKFVTDLADKLKDTRTEKTLNITKIPKEAIMVLFDASSSMIEECYDEVCKMKRIDAIKQVFDSFSNRTMAYNLHHVISLVKFNSRVEALHPFTENLDIFKKHVHALEAAGMTRLYDALRMGHRELLQIQKSFPACRLRIICLTDGIDTGSNYEPVDVAVSLMRSNIVVDSVLVGKEDNTVLHGISNVTGGYCFNPKTGKDALKLFEMETVLSMEMRKKKERVPVSSITTVDDLTKIFATHGYDEKPELELPPMINSKVAATAEVIKKKTKESKTGRIIEKDKRVLEELRNIHCDPHPFYQVFPCESDFTFWKILMQGPPNTPYENGVFELYCQFGPDYPVKPPLVRFITPIYHCNVNSVGRICHNIFDRTYSAHITMKEILDAVYGLLIAPEPTDPLDSVLAEEFLANNDKYQQEAKKQTQSTTGSSMVEMEKIYVGKDSSGIPSHLICKLSKKVFVDPVISPQGFVYERKEIEQYIKVHGTDPDGNKLALINLKPDKNMKRCVEEYRESLIQETD